MDTPIVDFVKAYAQSDKARFHMPGHKGVSFFGCESLDITEIKGADELFVPEGIILGSERNASSLFGTSRTLYSAGGSTQSIHAMLFLGMMNAEKDKKPFVLAGRNAHKAFIYAAAKLDFDVKWIYPESADSICSCVITAEMLAKSLGACEYKPFAVYVTSPDYLGGISDIKALSDVCKEHGVPLLVDNAHGAYLAFCENNMHPIALGADMCCDSAHKTLPVLTGGGYLHIAADDKYGFAESAVRSMSLFGSTSPSYLIMQSLDMCNRYMSDRICADINGCIHRIENVRKVMAQNSISDISAEPLKITADFRYNGIEDFENIGDYFRSFDIEPEYADRDFVVFMVSPFNSEKDFKRLEKAFENIRLTKRTREEFVLPCGKSVLSVRDAVFAVSEEIPVSGSEGRICAVPTVSCPPAIPIAVSGEIITDEHIRMFEHYGIEKIVVIK
ncbi:MAG: PLP-dependent transferase [Clostridia bacterium]|nr:PLP-dependent transferase [Clostridia bacterium]